MSRVPTNVAAGAALLDERLPGWREVIDPDTLELANGCNCILGQVFGDYGKAIDILALTHEEAVRYGFHARPRQRWDALTNAWRRVIGGRR